jgi:transposase-like protein
MFKHKMIRKMIGPDAISATALSKQVDIPQSTLSTWLRKAGIDSSHLYPNPPNGTMPMVPKTPNDWSAEEKLKAVLETSSLSDEQLGAFFHSNGVSGQKGQQGVGGSV